MAENVEVKVEAPATEVKVETITTPVTDVQESSTTKENITPDDSISVVAPSVITMASTKVDLPTSIPEREDNLSYVIRDMAAFDITPIMDPKKIDEVSRENVQFLINRLFGLEREKNEWGVFGVMPDRFVDKTEFRLPREKPIPKIKPMTRWEKFAKEKTIQKKKRGRMVWDENLKDWVPRHGYKSAKHNQDKVNWAIEVKEGADIYENPFHQKKAEKALVKAKQEKRELRNKVEAMGEKLPHGVTDFSQPTKKRHRGKEGLKEALRRAQVSSASFGTHDKRAENESVEKQPKRKKVKEVGASEEKDKYLKTLTRMEQGHFSKDKAARLGQGSLENTNSKKNKIKQQKVKKTSKRSKAGGKVKRKGQQGDH